MRANLVVIGSHGDVLPFIALGEELQRRGYSVTLATAEPFEPLVRQHGMQFASLATTAQFNAMIADPDLWRPIIGLTRFFEAAWRLLRPTYDFVTANHDPGRTITVASTLALGARIAQERHGMPLATIHLAPFLVSSRYDPPRMPGLPLPAWLPAPVRHRALAAVERWFLEPLCEPVNQLRAELGLAPARGIVHSWWNSPDRVIAMFPAWFSAPQPDWPAQLLQVNFPEADLFGDRASLDETLRQFLDSGPKPIIFTFGSAMLHADDLIGTALDLCRRSGHRGIIVSPVAPAVPAALAGQIVHIPYAPFRQLFPRCAAVVHHGGIGTVACAMAAGLPQLLVPLAFDHFDEAVRVERRALGTSIHRSLFTAARAQAALERILASPAVALACAGAALRLRDTNGIIQACDALELMPLMRGARPVLDLVATG